MTTTINADNGVVSGSAGLKSSADSSGVLALQTNGTTAISIDASQAVSFTNAPTVTGGTANGVAYLNGSKVLTTGSALVFDGTNLAIGSVTPSTWRLDVKSAGTGVVTNGIRFNRSSLTTQYGVLNYEGGQFNNVVVNTAGSGCYWGVLYSTDGATTTQPLTLDASGRLGIGVTAPAAPIHVLADSNGYSIRVKGRASDSYGDISFNNNADTVNYAFLSANNAGTYFGTATALPLIFYTNNAEKARINSAGMLSVNYTSTITNGLFVVSSNGTKQSLLVSNDDSVKLYSLGTGTVTCSGGVLGFTSDERIKIDDGNYSGGLNAVLNITPKYFYYKNSEGNKDETKGRELGFFAQNIQQTCGLEVVHQPEDPDALLGIHDRGVMAVLVSAIQEMKAIIDTQASTITTLTDRITALENK